MEFIMYLIGLIFGFKQETIIVEQPKTEIVEIMTTTTPEKKTIFTVFKEEKPVIVEPVVATTTTVEPVIQPLVGPVTQPIVQSAPQPTIVFVSQPNVEYNLPTTPITQPTMEEVTISEPVFTLEERPNRGKYIGTFTVSDTSKKVVFTYEGTSERGGKSKGGMEFQPNQAYEIGWEFEGTFNYKIDYNNGEVIKEGTFTVTE